MRSFRRCHSFPPSESGTVALDGQVTIQLRSSASATCLEGVLPLPARLDKQLVYLVYKDKTD